ncbi:MAG: hypothetical protein KJ069_26420 [Anaerolineae bacterium]|nr:hypothetical protein [Anaerolineae bacterium]
MNFIKVILLVAIQLILLIACQPTTSHDNETVLVTGTIPNEQEVALFEAMTVAPTRSITQTATSTSTPIPTAASSPTPLPTETPLPLATVTPTPWPTLPPNEAADKVLALLADNQNPECLLPCWWGATPGQTHWHDIEPFLKSFALEIKANSSAALVYLPLHEAIEVPGFDGYVAYSWNDSGVIKEISLKPMNISGYDPQTMMILHGVPDEVWLKTFPVVLPGEVLPFHLLLVYQEKGISLRYYVDAVKTGETITACFEPEVVEVERPDLFPAGPRIYLWEPGQQKTIDEIVSIPGETYFPLEGKSDLTPQTLFEMFTNPDELPCIDTPAEQWREP